MSASSRQLRQELSGGIRENPLLTLGVAAQVLEVGLAGDELYDYILKDVARRLIMRFHTDPIRDSSRPEHVRILQGRLSQAYEELKDRGKYEQALSDFRDIKSVERSETRQLREKLERASHSLELFQRRQLNHDKAVKDLAQERRVLDKDK